MSASLTITGTAGPAVAVTAKTFTNVTIFTVDTEKQMIYFYQEGAYREISIVAAATVTATKSGTSWTLTIS